MDFKIWKALRVIDHTNNSQFCIIQEYNMLESVLKKMDIKGPYTKLVEAYSDENYLPMPKSGRQLLKSWAKIPTSSNG